MLKEMYEQPKAVADTLNPRIKDNRIEIEELGMTDEEIRAVKKDLYRSLRLRLSYRCHSQVCV